MRIQFSSSMGSMGIETERYKLGITANGQTRTQVMETQPVMAMRHFRALIAQAAGTPNPCKITISRQEDFWSELDQKFKPRETALEFRNNAYGNRD